MMWPWKRWRADKEAINKARQRWRDAQQLRAESDAQVNESRRLRERNGFGEAIVRAMGGKT